MPEYHDRFQNQSCRGRKTNYRVEPSMRGEMASNDGHRSGAVPGGSPATLPLH